MAENRRVRVSVIMGSQSDWETMSHSVDILAHLSIDYESRIISAHRTPDRLIAYAKSAAGRGLYAIIAGAGGAAHLPGMVAAMTCVPVLGVPVQSAALSGADSLLSIVQMPGGVPVATFAIGRAGAINAALFAAALLAKDDEGIAQRLEAWRTAQSQNVPEFPPNSEAIDSEAIDSEAIDSAITDSAITDSAKGA